MWLQKMFPYYFFISKKDTGGWVLGVELGGGKNPDQDRLFFFHLFSSFFFFFWPRGHTEGKARRETTILVSD